MMKGSDQSQMQLSLLAFINERHSKMLGVEKLYSNLENTTRRESK
jgi:hypothetical protein